MNEKKEPKPDWLDRVKATHAFHITKLREDSKWTVTKSAKALNRSIGSVSQELVVFGWLKSHYDEMIKIEYFHEVIEWVRKKKHALSREGADID